MILALAETTGEAHKIASRPGDFSLHGFDEGALFDALIAERNGEAVGLCLFFLTFSSWLGEPGLFVQDLYVGRSERGKGLGHRLLREAARWGRQRDATHLRLNVDRANATAKRFYENLDMEFRDTEDTYHIGGPAFADLAGDAE